MGLIFVSSRGGNAIFRIFCESISPPNCIVGSACLLGKTRFKTFKEWRDPLLEDVFLVIFDYLIVRLHRLLDGFLYLLMIVFVATILGFFRRLK